MSTPLDHYTFAYLHSGYSFNDHRLKFTPSLDSEDGLDASKFAHGRDSNLGLGVELAKCSLGMVSNLLMIWFWVILLYVMLLLPMQIQGLWLDECRDHVVLWKLNMTPPLQVIQISMGFLFFVRDDGRYIHMSRVATLKPTSVDGAALGLGEDLNKVLSIADAIPVSGLHLKAGFDIISYDPINSLNDKRTPFSRLGVLQAGAHILPPCNVHQVIPWRQDVHVGNADVTNDEDDVANVDFGNTLPQNNASSSQLGIDVHVETHSTTFAQQSNPSAESKSDSLNTGDLSPLKVFASKDEAWQEVQSKKKKKVVLVQAQYSKLITRATIS
ncbi:hypothetical protein PanWU01x14_208190 [Parasponia andersonii]|uniref:Uncharacterized protein n=1 Tax=Parasponia andersonii TaxID=3476 RepID=A0A2P5BUV1_PARAD|nr:hypothetical protein PanWU01x14_208190 [Parasponia andersonii]